MSSSLFYDCYAPYESYPPTIHVDGDKKFGELRNNDILYILIYDYMIFPKIIIILKKI